MATPAVFEPAETGCWFVPHYEDVHMVAGRSRSASLKRLLCIQSAAADLIAAGFAVCVLGPDGKTAKIPKWNLRSARPDHFRRGSNIGIMTGPLSHCKRAGYGLVCVDLDTADAIAHADKHLPATGMIDGRPGKPRSHRWYLVRLSTIPDEHRACGTASARALVRRLVHPGPRNVTYRDTAGGEILSLRGTGAQAAVPPTTRSDGEHRTWNGGQRDKPAVVQYDVLFAAVRDLAVRCGFADGEKSLPIKTPLNGFTGGITGRRAACGMEAVKPIGVYSIHQFQRPWPADTLPTGPGQRNACIYALARALKARGGTAATHEATVRDWFAAALPVIRTKEWKTTWADFVHAWDNVSAPVGGVIASLRATAPNGSGTAAERLRAVCATLGVDGREFHLSGRTAGELVGISQPTARRLLERFVRDGVLVVAQAGRPDPIERTATTYRLAGFAEPPAGDPKRRRFDPAGLSIGEGITRTAAGVWCEGMDASV